MTLAASAGFALIEDGTVWQYGETAVSIPVPQDGFYLSYPALAAAHQQNGRAIVQIILLTLLAASKHNIPVVLDRTGQLTVTQWPQNGFAVGLMTSGTTGTPKLIWHDWSALCPKQITAGQQSIWLLCYHPMSYAGLQVILQALMSGDTLVVSNSPDIACKAALALQYQVNCLSATPSIFRTLASCWTQQVPPLKRLTLGGETAQQDTLELAKSMFPAAAIRHIYALTEAGVVFSVKDACAGFPIGWLNQSCHGWNLAIEHDELILIGKNRQIRTGDRVMCAAERCYFVGRTDDVVNVAGAKVDLMQLESEILQLPAIKDARVFAKRNPITGFVVAVEICTGNMQQSQQAIAQLFAGWPKYQRPVVVRYVEQISLSANGKKQRIEC
jgi:acyl-coenzyme A synthetase/AMP-(fatty) acid ligase